MAAGIHGQNDLSEVIELFKPQGLYLKPLARANISVKLPQFKDPGQSISNWDLMERIKKMVNPIEFNSIKVAKSTIEFVRFEADVNNRETMLKVIKLLDNSQLKVIGFYEVLKVKAGEAKYDFPTRNDWDSYFRDAKNMNEMRPGERPDTIYFANLPCKWYYDLRHRAKDNEQKPQPSEFVLRRVFETFGEIRSVDIPVVDPYRKDMSRTGIRQVGFSFGNDLIFEGYVQYVEYISFVKAMDALRGMKLVHVDEDGRATAAYIKVDFDRTKHLSDKSNRRRRLERERLVELKRIKKAEEEARRIAEEAEKNAHEKDKTDRRRHREEKRRVKHLERKRVAEEQEIENKIRKEERKILVAQRKLESIRLLTELFKRVEEEKKKEEVEKIEEDLEEAVQREVEERERLQKDEENRRQRLLKNHENRLRKKVTKKYHEKEEKQEEFRREELRRRIKREKLSSVAASSSKVDSDDDDDDDLPVEYEQPRHKSRPIVQYLRRPYNNRPYFRRPWGRGQHFDRGRGMYYHQQQRYSDQPSSSRQDRPLEQSLDDLIPRYGNSGGRPQQKFNRVPVDPPLPDREWVQYDDTEYNTRPSTSVIYPEEEWIEEEGDDFELEIEQYKMAKKRGRY